MIRKTDGKIGSIEAGSILFILVASKIADTTMVFFLRSGQTATALLNIVAGTFIFISMFFLLSVVKKHHNKNIIELNYLYFGKIIGFIINFLLFITLLSAVVYHTRFGIEQISVLFLKMTPKIIVYSLGLTLTVFIAMKGLETIGRVAWMLTPIFIITFITLILVTYVSNISLHWQNNFPLLGPGIFELIKQGYINSGHYGEFILFASLVPFIREYRDYRQSSIYVLIYSIFTTSIFLWMLVSLYGYPAVNQSAFPFQEFTRALNLGRYFYNLEVVFSFVWIMAELIRFSIYLYLTTYIFAQTFKINEHEPLLIPIAFIILLIGLIITSLINVIEIRTWFLKMDGLFFIVLPIILWTMSKLRHRRFINENG